MEANDEDALTKIVNQMSSRLDAQLSTARSYNPESVALLENCKVKTIGNYIYLVISEKQEEIEAMIEEALEYMNRTGRRQSAFLFDRKSS